MKGDMALIGPRPLLVKYLPLYSPAQARRHEARPLIASRFEQGFVRKCLYGFYDEIRDFTEYKRQQDKEDSVSVNFSSF